MKRSLQGSISNTSLETIATKALQPSISNTSEEKTAAKALREPHTRTFYTIMPDGTRTKMRLQRPEQMLELVVNMVNAVPPGQPDIPDMWKIDVFRGLLVLLQDPQSTGYWGDTVLKGLAIADFNKLGRCLVCTNFFVRARKDQKCCSKKCSNAYRVRKWREKYPECYKPRRISRAESVEKEKPHVVPERKRKDLVVSLPVRRKNRSRKRPESEQDRSAGSRKAAPAPA